MGLNVADAKVQHCQSAAEVRALARAVLERKRARCRPPRRIPINDLTPRSFPIPVMRPVVFVPLDSTAPDPLKYPTIASIIDLVCSVYGVAKMDLLSHRRAADIVRPRQVAQALACKLTPHSIPTIGKQFGGRDHTTLIHSRDRIRQLRKQDPAFDAHMTDLENRLGGYHPQIKVHRKGVSWTERMDARLKQLIATPKSWQTITDLINQEFGLTLTIGACYGRMYWHKWRRPTAKTTAISEAA